jgi:hypothetical protein
MMKRVLLVLALAASASARASAFVPGFNKKALGQKKAVAKKAFAPIKKG